MRREIMTHKFKLTTAIIALTAYAGPAFAQDAPAPAAGQEASADSENEVFVTARRRSESLLEVPIAITAFSGEQLENQGALDITDVSATTPNVNLEVSRGTNSTLSAFIRGVGQQDPVAGFEAGVGIYLDDVYLNRPQAAVLDIYDVERIEILRGPQGTLYGRNTIGGAIKYVTRRLPSDPELRLRGTVGTYQQTDLVVSGSTPVSGDRSVRFGAALARLSRGGFGDNLTTGQENYNKDVWAGRMSLEVNNEHNVFVRLQGDLTQDNSNTRGGHRLIPSLVTHTPVLDDVFDSQGALITPEQDVRAWGTSLYIEVKPWDNWTLRSITAYRRDRTETPIDFDALPAVDVDVPGVYRNRQTSQELQILYNNGPVNALLGAYYLDANAQTIFDVRLPGNLAALTFGDVDTETFAIFGDFTYDFAEMFSISLGGRYTWDQRHSVIDRGVYLGGGGSPFFGGTGVRIVNQSSFNGTADFEKFTPRASISFRPDQSNMIYASYSRGFKGGGFDPRGVTTACRTPAGALCTTSQQIYDFMSFDPETVTSYELGWHAQLFDRRLTFSLAAFYADYTDVQVPGSAGAIVNNIPTFVGITTNAGKARFAGVEFEGNAILARDFGTADDRLSFSWSLGYLNADYKEFITAVTNPVTGVTTQQDVADLRRIQNTPEWTASGTLSYEVPVGPGRLNMRSTVSYRSGSQQFELPIPGLDQGGFALWDASLMWRSSNDVWSVGLHGRNLTNKRYIVSGYNFLRQNGGAPYTSPNGSAVGTGAFVLPGGNPGLSPALGAEGVLTAYYGNPRQVYLTVGLNFR
jgi:iron complex outermembrane receptor protein